MMCETEGWRKPHLKALSELFPYEVLGDVLACFARVRAIICERNIQGRRKRIDVRIELRLREILAAEKPPRINGRAFFHPF